MPLCKKEGLMRKKCFFMLPLLFALAVAGLLAQSDTAQISGFVLDPSGAGVPNARITIVNESTLTERRAVTNEQGYYAISALPPGFYTVTAEASGFKKFQK